MNRYEKIGLLIIWCVVILGGVAIEKFVQYEYEDYNKHNTPLLKSSIYKNETWVQDLSDEQSSSYNFTYASFVGYKPQPHAGKYVNIDENSIRRTWSSNTYNQVVIHCYGGSTMFGTDSRDDFTIPSQISKILTEEGYSVRIYNYGMSGYDSNTELIQFQENIKNKNIPHIAIFYDGVNDPCNAYINDGAGEIPNFFTRKYQYDYFKQYEKTILPPEIIQTIAKRIYIIKFINRYIPLKNTPTETPNTTHMKELGYSSYTHYIENIKMIRSVSNEYGVITHFFLQPYIITKTPTTDEENDIKMWMNDKFKGMEDVSIEFYKNVKKDYNKYKIFDISNALNENTTIYIDDCHISEYGNRLVANKITDVLRFDLKK